MQTITLISILTSIYPYILLALLFLYQWLRETKRLPAKVQQVIDLVGEARVRDFVLQVQAMSGLTPAQRHQRVVAMLLAELEGKADQELIADPIPPEGFVRMAAEWAYQREVKGRL